MIRVKGSIFSFTPPASPEDDGSYLRWHLLDHMPEQFQLPGIQHAMRYIADCGYLDARIAGDGKLADIGNAMNYFVGDPVEQTLADFAELGPRLAEVGRYPDPRRPLHLGMYALEKWYAAPAALVSAEVVPWRAHRGVALLVEEPVVDDRNEWLLSLHTRHFPELLSVPGVAGAWMYGTTHTWQLPPQWPSEPMYVTAIYLDADPLTTTKALTPLLEQRWASGVVRPLFAGPLRTMIQWDAWPADEVVSS